MDEHPLAPIWPENGKDEILQVFLKNPEKYTILWFDVHGGGAFIQIVYFGSPRIGGVNYNISS